MSSLLIIEEEQTEKEPIEVVNRYIGTDSNSLHSEATKLLREIGDCIYYHNKFLSGEITTIPPGVDNPSSKLQSLYDVLEVLKGNLCQ